MQPLTPEPQGAGLGAPPFLVPLIVRVLPLVFINCVAIKRCLCVADSQKNMIISEEQVRLAVEYLRKAQCGEPATIACDEATGVCPEFLREVHRSIMMLPDLRDERVKHAQSLLESNDLPAEVVAAKMIGRMISDSIR